MKVLLKAFTQSEVVDGANCFLLDLTKELAKALLDQRELFQMAKSKDDRLYSLTFWGIPGEFYDVDEAALCERLGEEGAARFSRSEWVDVDDGFVVTDITFAELLSDNEEDEEPIEAVRTEIDMTHVSERGVHFRSGLKHAAVHVESGLLPFELLLNVQNG